MAAPEPPGTIDAQKYLKTGPYSSQAQPAPDAFCFQPAPSPYPLTNFPRNHSIPPKSNSFPPLPGASNLFKVSPVLIEGSSPTPSPYYFMLDNGPPTSLYPSGPPTSSQQPKFSQNSSLSSHTPPANSSVPISSVNQNRGLSPVSSSLLDGARLMALLTTQSAGESLTSEDEIFSIVGELRPPDFSDLGVSPPSEGNYCPGKEPPMLPAQTNSLPSTPLPNLLQDCKLPRGRILKGERATYDIDVRKPDEAQPQLEARYITVYGSDSVPTVGNQIAVNKAYICYVRAATMRILNRNSTALPALLPGHTDRVTDMAFYTEDVNRLASASKDGRMIVRDILESRVADGRVQIKEHILVALQFTGDWESTHPRICWHKYEQDVLVVAMGKYVLSVDVNKVQQGAPQGGFNMEEPVVCHVMELLEGISIVGEHEEDVTDLALPPYISSHIASASQDGLVRIWGEKKSSSVSVFTPHVGEVVGAVAFLSAPGHPEDSILLTAGFEINRELKLWAPEASASAARSGMTMWQCIQTFEFQSSAAGKDLDNAFFNQVAVAPRAGLIVVANAKRNAIYVLHVQFGSKPEKAQMNYLTEFSVTMPILSLTVTEDSIGEGGQGAVQLYCVQTQAIQQYTLLVSQCLPPVTHKDVKKKSPLVDKPAAKVPTATPSPTSRTVPEKVVPRANTAVAEANLVASVTPVVPPRYEQLTTAFECLLDGGQPMSEMAKLIATTKLGATELAKELTDDPQKSVIVDAQVTQTVMEKISQVSTSPVKKAEAKAEAPKTAGQLPAAPPRIPAYSKRPPKVVEQRYVPAAPGFAKKQADEPEETVQSAVKIPSRGGLTRQLSGGGDVNEIKHNVPVPPGLGRQPSGSFGLRRQQSRKREEFELIKESVQAATTDVEKTSSFSNNNSGVVNLHENEERRGPSDTFSTGLRNKNTQNQSGLCPPHLITPSELMLLAGCPKGPEVDALNPCQADSTRLVGDNAKTLDTRSAKEKEAAQLRTMDLAMRAGNTNDTVSGQSEASKILQGSNVESSEQDSASQSNGPPTLGAALPMYSQSTFEDETSRDVNTDDMQDQTRERSTNSAEIGCELPGMSTQGSSMVKGRKNKNKTSGGGVGGVGVLKASMQLPIISPLNTAILPEGEASSSWKSNFVDTGMIAQMALMQDSLNQLVNMQNELQKQMTVMVSVPVAKEGKRLEVAMGQRMEKVLKAHVDAMWARLTEENAKREKAERERVQQMTTLLSSLINKDMPAALELGLRREFLAVMPTVSQTILPPLQKAMSSVVNETFQKGIAEKLLPQLERSVVAKLEATITRQLQTQFQLVGKQTLQDAIHTSFEAYIIPAFENSCQAMIEDVDSTFKQVMAEHVLNAQQQFSSLQSPLASTLQETVASASALAESLKGELTESNKRLAELVESAGTATRHGSNRDEANGFLEKILSLQHVEERIEPTVKLTKLLNEDKLEEAFDMALSLSDVGVVSWLCNQIDPLTVFQTMPVPLSQGVLLSLVQQLGVDIGTDTKGKLNWIQEAVLSLNPNDPGLAPHVRIVLEQLRLCLQRQTAIAGPGELSNQMRLVIHVVNSMLTACK